MDTTHVVGIDPGLVHTGCVRLVFRPQIKTVLVEHLAIETGNHAATARAWSWRADQDVPHTFIEKYQPRAIFGTDARMVALVNDLRARMPSAKVVLNTGSKKVVKQPLMELLHVWRFSTVTHHQDLRSAARIALLGMLKDRDLNKVLADVVLDHLNGRSWDVRD